MVELDDTMRDCLIEANNHYPDESIMDKVVIAVQKWVVITGHSFEIEDEEEGEEYLLACATFLIDCMIFNWIDRGIVEFDGIEDGEMIYRTTVEF